MSKRRVTRAWLGEARPVDPGELLGPRGLVAGLVAEGEREGEPASEGEGGGVDESGDERAGPTQAERDAFHRSMLTDARLARIESVISARLSSVTVVLDALLDPHNVAAILRTSEGLGLLRLHVVPNADGDGGVHRRITQDADKWLEVVRHRSGAEAASTLRSQGFCVLAGHLDAEAKLVTALPVDRPLALLFGHEHEGPSAQTLAACDGTFRIPMAGFSQSFNVSVAAAIALHAATSARRQHLGLAGDLSEDEKAALRSRYWRLGAKLARRVSGPPRRKD